MIFEKFNSFFENMIIISKNRALKKVGKKGVALIIALCRTIFLIAVGYIILFPVFSAFSSAIKTEAALFDMNLYWIPKDVTLENFSNAFKLLDIPNTFVRTLSLNIVSAVIEVATCAFTAYGFARFNFKLKKPLQFLLILSILIPMQFYIVSVFINYKHLDFLGILGLFNNITGIDLRPNILNTNLTFYLPSLFAVGLRSGILIYIYQQFFIGLPKELEEAAWIDGAGPIKTFLKIAVPSSTVVILVIVVFSVIWHYNDYYLSVMFFDGDYPLAVQLSQLPTMLSSNRLFNTIAISTATKNNIIMAGCLIFILPMLIFYLCVQNKFVQSIDRIGITG